MGDVSVPNDKRRSRPFLMELAIVLALLWAAASWIGGGSDDAARLAGRNLPVDPATTGSVRLRAAQPVKAPVTPDDGTDAPEGAVRGLLDAAAIVGRR